MLWLCDQPLSQALRCVCLLVYLLRSKVTSKESELPSLVWWFLLLIPAPRRQRWECCKFKARLSNKTLKHLAAATEKSGVPELRAWLSCDLLSMSS